MKTLVAWWGCAVLCCSGHAAGMFNPRFLVAVDASFSTSKEFDPIRNIVTDMVVSGFGGQIRPGERFEIWSFSERVRKLVIFDWKEDSTREAVRPVELALSRQRNRGQTNFRLLSEAVSEVARTSPVFTFVLLTDGEDNLVGTPFDARVNRAFAEKSRSLKREREPFVVVMLAENGAWTRCAISAGGLQIELPSPSPLEQVKEASEILQKPLEVARTAASLANGVPKPDELPPVIRSVALASKDAGPLPLPDFDQTPKTLLKPSESASEKPSATALAGIPIAPVTRPLEKPGSSSDLQGVSNVGPSSDAAVAASPQRLPPASLEKIESPLDPPPSLGSKGDAAAKEDPGSPRETTPSNPSVEEHFVKDGEGTAAVAEAFLAPHQNSPSAHRFWFIGIGFYFAFCFLLLLWWVRARSQPVAQSSLISQYMDKENTMPERPEKR